MLNFCGKDNTVIRADYKKQFGGDLFLFAVGFYNETQLPLLNPV